jgi:hypothetical protein
VTETPEQTRPPVPALNYEPAVHSAWSRTARAVLWAGVIFSSLGIARIVLETLAAAGQIDLPSWVARLAEETFWSLPASIALLAGWGLNALLLTGSILGLQRRPISLRLLQLYANFTLAFQILWTLSLCAYIAFERGAFHLDVLFLLIATLMSGIGNAALAALLLIALKFPPTRQAISGQVL